MEEIYKVVLLVVYWHNVRFLNWSLFKFDEQSILMDFGKNLVDSL